MPEAKPLSNELLKEIMTDSLVDRGYCQDFDQATKAGAYRVDSSTTGNPAGGFYGVLVCAEAERMARLQLFVPHGNRGVFLRIYWVGEWLAWGKVSISQVS